MNYVSLVIVSCLCGLAIGQIARPLINIPSGQLRGHFKVTANGRNYAAFEGIPYARPPVGKYRFREPQPIKPWRGIWEANYLHTCLQYDHFSDPKNDRVIGSEDCLYLNVYTPQLNQAALLDVIIHIHGGAFMFGASHIYGDKYLMEKNVVFVNLNYRLGPLGFLSTGDNLVPGNNGMKDQVLALKWIKSNIQHFGGNPNSITLTGMSAGGSSVHLHYMSPLSTGLFNRGFSLSGTALNPWVLAENIVEKSRRLAASVGCESINIREMVDCMRFRPGRQLVQNVAQFFGFLYNPFSPFGVVVEPQGTLDPFLPEHPYQLLKNGNIQNITWITSVTQSEGLYPAAEFMSDPSYLNELELRWTELAPHILDYNYTAALTDHKTIAEMTKTHYLRGKPISKNTFPQLVQMIGDRLFVSDSYLAAKLHAQMSSSPVYYYYFTYRGGKSKSELLSRSQENLGVCHGDDLVYVLSSKTDTKTTQKDENMSELLIQMWLDYAKTGVPKFGNATWERVSVLGTDPMSYLEISSPTETTEHSTNNFGNAEFWHSLPLQENKNLFAKTKEEL